MIKIKLVNNSINIPIKRPPNLFNIEESPDTIFNLTQKVGAMPVINIKKTKGIYDKFVGALTEAADNLVVGDALDSATQIGPVVDEKQLQQNVDYIKLAADEGWRRRCL